MVKRNSVRPDMQPKKKGPVEVQRHCNDWGTSEQRAACFEAAWAQHRERYGLSDGNCKDSPSLQLPPTKPSPTPKPAPNPAPIAVKKGILKLSRGLGAQRKLVHFAKAMDDSSDDDLMG